MARPTLLDHRLPMWPHRKPSLCHPRLSRGIPSSHLRYYRSLWRRSWNSRKERWGMPHTAGDPQGDRHLRLWVVGQRNGRPWFSLGRLHRVLIVRLPIQLDPPVTGDGERQGCPPAGQEGSKTRAIRRHRWPAKANRPGCPFRRPGASNLSCRTRRSRWVEWPSGEDTAVPEDLLILECTSDTKESDGLERDIRPLPSGIP